MKIRTKALLAAGATVALTMGGATVAMADSNVNIYNDGILRATATFTAYGEHLKVYDQYADGWGARSYYDFPGTSSYADHTSGAGTAPTDVNLSIPDGQTINYNICSKDGSTVLACTPKIRDTA